MNELVPAWEERELRARLNDSKTLDVNLPEYVHNSRYGAKVLEIDPSRIHEYLDISQEVVKKLTESYVYPKATEAPGKR